MSSHHASLASSTGILTSDPEKIESDLNVSCQTAVPYGPPVFVQSIVQGDGVARCIKTAMKNAGVQPEEVRM